MRSDQGAESEQFEQADSGWSEQEFAEFDSGDKRLNQRLIVITEQVSQLPQCSINRASEDWAAAKGAYRFFDNPKASAEKILGEHQRRTLSRMREEEIVLAVQDTTSLNYNWHKDVVGLGPIGDSVSDAQGLLMHSTLCVTPQGLPLGLLTQQLWAREGYKQLSKKELEKLPIEEKESFKWIQALREIHQLSASLPQTTVVAVGDRENDIYEYLVEAQRLQAKYVIRASADRNIVNEEAPHLWEFLDAQESQATIQLSLPARHGEKARTATLSIKFAPVTFEPPTRAGAASSRELPRLSLWVIMAVESNPPAGEEALEWVLLTNIPVITVEQALEKFCWYRCRWQIEVFHKILKSGCRVEHCFLESAERLMRYLTLLSVVAWRIFWLTHIKRTHPLASPRVILTATEYAALCLIIAQRRRPIPPPTTAAETVLAIAQLGGFLARKGDGNPGPFVTWHGWQRLSDAATMYAAMNQNSCG